MPKLEEATLSKTLKRGVLAALVTPVDDQGRVDPRTFSRLIDFVAERGVDGVVIGGATGEYASFSCEQKGRLIQEAARQAACRFAVLAGIGAQTAQETLFLAGVAADSECRAVLLPMPYFFRYRQDDLREYCAVVGRASEVPCLLYHLPSFTNRLDLETVIELIESDADLAGIKDSSGDRENLAPLAKARIGKPFDLFVGDDSLALSALSAGWDGVISGIACFLPELLVRLAESFRAGDLEAARERQDELDQVIEELVKLPIPWAVRIGLEVRGISPGPLPLPLSPRRKQQVAAYRDWCRDWLQGKAWVQPLPASELKG
jgi:4-hydroxy-tetrahydrodipicolinate synthase